MLNIKHTFIMKHNNTFLANGVPHTPPCNSQLKFRIFADGEPTANTTVTNPSLSSLPYEGKVGIGSVLFRRVAMLLCVLMLGLGNVWGDETFTFPSSGSFSAVISYSISGDHGSDPSCVANDKIYFEASGYSLLSDVGLESNKLGIIFRPSADCQLKIVHQATTPNSRTITAAFYKAADPRLYQLFVAADGSNMSKYVIDNYSADYEWWKNNGVIKLSSGRYAQDDSNAKKTLSGETEKTGLRTAWFTNTSMTSTDTEEHEYIVKASASASASDTVVIFRANTDYCIYGTRNSSGIGFKKFIFEPVGASYTVTLDPDGGTIDATATGWTKDGSVWKQTKTGSFDLPTEEEVTKDNMDFDGWYSGQTLVPSPYTPTDNVTLTAHWKEHVVSTDATLKSLTVNGNAIELQEGVFTYNYELPFGTTTAPTIAAVANDANATVGTPSSSLTQATVVVTAEDETTTKTYTINFTIASSLDLEMVWDKSKKRCDGTTPSAVVKSTDDPIKNYLSISFDGGAEGNSLNTSNTKDKSFTITAKDGFAFESISFFGKLQADCEYSIDGGANWETIATTSASDDKCYSNVFTGATASSFKLRNTADNGAWIRNMQIVVKEAGSTKSNDATLSALSATCSGNTVTLSPAFVASTTDYTATLPVGKTISDVTVTATKNHSGASVGDVSKSGKVASVTVTAEDGTTTKTYKITFSYTYTLTFNSKGGSEVVSQNIVENSHPTKPADPTRDGYTFAGWSETDGGEVVADITSLTITGNKTLYAKWTKDKTVSTVTWTGVPTTVYPGGKYSFSVSTNSDATLNASQLTATGTASLEASLSEKTITVNFTMAANAESAPSFKWAIPEGTTTSALNAVKNDIALGSCSGGGDETIFSLVMKDNLPDETIKRNVEKRTLTSTDATISGASEVYLKNVDGSNDDRMQIKNSNILFYGGNAYVFINLNKALAEGDEISFTHNQSGTNQIGFTISNSRSSIVYTSENSYTIPANSSLIGSTELYVWRNNNSTYVKTLTITRSGSGGGGETQTPTMTWSEDIASGVTKSTTESPFTISASANTIGAITYSLSNVSGTITIDSNTGEVTATTAGSATVTATVAAAGCYSSTSISYNLTVTAPKYDITKADATHGSFTVKAGSNEVSQAAEGTEITLSATPATGYQLGSWSVYKTGDQSTTISVSSNKFTMPAHPVTVAATFTPKTYSLTLKANDGASTADIQRTVTYDANFDATNFTPHARTGYKLKGYYTSETDGDMIIGPDGSSWKFEGGTHSGYTESQKWKGTENKTLYAQWTADQYTINYRDQGDQSYSGSNSSSLPKKHTYGQTTTLVDGVKDGFTFDGWFTSSNCSGSAVAELGATDYTANITLYAKWTSTTISVTGVSLNKTTTSLAVGGNETLTATVAPANATNQNVTWSSDGEDVATVEDGVVTAVAEGEATITVTTVDGGKTATCTVTVTSDTPQPVGEEATLTWTLRTGSGEASITTTNKESTSTILAATSMLDLTNNGLTITSSGKDGRTTKIEAPASKDDGKYLYVTITVPDGYQFIPATATLDMYGVSAGGSADLYISDNKSSTPIFVTGQTVKKDTKSTITLSNSENKSFKGTITLKIYCYGNSMVDYRLGPTIAITGTVQSTSPTPTTYTVTYDGNGASGTAPTQEPVAADTEITLKANTFTVPDGKIFNGWLCDIDEQTYTANSKYTMTAANTTFTAQWADEPTPGECSGTFNYAYNDATRLVGGVHKNPQGGDVVAKGAALDNPWSPTVSGTGLTSVVFNECKYSAPEDISTVPYYSSYIMVPSDKTIVITVANGYSGTLKIKAGPEKSGSRTVTLKCDGQVDQVQTTTGVRDENNYGELTFLLHAGANTLSFGSSNTWISAMDICVKAGVTAHTLTIAPNGGTLTNTQGWTPAGDNYTRQVNTGEPFSLPAITRADYTLVNWTDGDGNIYTDQQLIADGISADATFTANWAVPATGITVIPETAEVEIGGSDVQLSANLTPQGCAPEAISWSSEYTTLATVDNTGKVHAVALQANGNAFQIRANTARLTGSNYYATVKTYYLVTFNGNNGGTPAVASARYYGGDNLVKLPTVTPSGDASFLGWYDAATGGTKIGNAGEFITPTASTTLYAHYSTATYTIKFAGTERSDMTNVGVSTATEITAPTRSGYDFIGWTVTSGLDATKAKFGDASSSVTNEINECSDLIANSTPTSSVYVKNLGVGGATVILTANWHAECPSTMSEGGEGGTQTIYDFTFVKKLQSDKDSTVVGGTISMSGIDDTPTMFNDKPYCKLNSSGYLKITLANNETIQVGDVISYELGATSATTCGIGYAKATDNVTALFNANETKTLTDTIKEDHTLKDVTTFQIWRSNTKGDAMRFHRITITRKGSGPTPVPGDCHYVTYHANAADATGSTIDETAYNKDKKTATIDTCGYTREGYNFVGWTTTKGGTTKMDDYDPEDEVEISADLDLYAVWAEIPKEPKQFELSGGSLGCFSSEEPATLTLDGSELNVTYILYKDGEETTTTEEGTGSAIEFSITEEGTYTVHATRDTYDVTMIGSAEYSKYTVDITSNPEDKSVATGTPVTFSATTKVTSAVASQYTYQWFSCDDKKYTNAVAVDAQATAMNSGTQTVSMSIAPAEAGTKYYFCLFTTPCGDTYRTAAAMLRATSSITTFTWTLDGSSTLTTDLPQGGRHTVAVTSNSVAPSVELVDGCTDVTLGNITTEGKTTTVEILLGSEASDFSLKASAPASGDHSALEQAQAFTTKACESGEAETIFEMHIAGYNSVVVNSTYGGSATVSMQDNHIEVGDKSYYKVQGQPTMTITLSSGEKLQAGDRIILNVAAPGEEKDAAWNFCKDGSSTSYGNITTRVPNKETFLTFTIPADNQLIGQSKLRIDSKNTNNRFYGLSIERAGATSGNTDAIETHITWDAPATVTKTASAEPFTYAATADATSLGSLRYTSSAVAVATVDATGKVTIVGEGETTICVQQVAFGCYAASNTLSYTLTVEGCQDSKPAIAITSGAQTKCPSESVTLTASDYETGATFQWYKGNSVISSATSATYTTVDAGEFYVIATKNCGVESNHITITNKSSDPIVKNFANEFTVKGNGNYYYRIMQLEAGVTATITNNGGMTGIELVTDANNIVYLKGAGHNVTADHTVVISVSDACGGGAVTQNVTIHEIPQTDKPSIAWIAEGTKNGGFEEGVKPEQSTNVALYKYLQDYYDVTACNDYSTTSEDALVAYYSQYDLIVMTDYPDSKTTDGKVKYTDAIGLLIDHRPILSFEAFVAGCSNWGISTDPASTTTTQTDLTLLCNAGDIFGDKTDKFKAGNAITVTSVTSGQGLQGFEPLDAPDFTMIGMITDNAVNYIACSERQARVEARMMVFGLNSNTMNYLTEDGKQMVHGFIDYLLISNPASVPDCSVIFDGHGAESSDWTDVKNWEGEKLPNQYATVRIDKPCVVDTTGAKVGNLKIHRSTSDDTYTGSITIPDTGALTIYKSLSRIMDSKYATLLPTEANDVIVQSTTDGNGALIIGAEEGTNAATVQMASKAYKNEENKKIWQYVGAPIQDAFLGTDFAGAYTYLWEETNNSGWIRQYTEQMIPFRGYGLSQSKTTPVMFTMDGLLNATSTQVLKLTHTNNNCNGMNLIANSWTAPIRITDMEPSDFGEADQTIYIWNTGRTEVGGTATTSGSANMTAGQWQTIPLEAAKQKGWLGDTLIASMQAFEVNTSKATTLTLDYSRIVMPGKDDKVVPAEMRAPQRAAANSTDQVDMMRIRVESEKMLVDQYLLEDERFTTGFDNGWDGGFMEGDGRSATFFSVNPELGDMAVNALPEIEGTLLGFVPNNEQLFTISFGYNGDEIYYLNDIVTRQSTAIQEGNTYQFIATGNEVVNRFIISRTAIDGPEIITDIHGAKQNEPSVFKFIDNNHMYILHQGRLYDGHGKLIKQGKLMK